jgi:hypothetical protein
MDLVDPGEEPVRLTKEVNENYPSVDYMSEAGPLGGLGLRPGCRIDEGSHGAAFPGWGIPKIRELVARGYVVPGSARSDVARVFGQANQH